MTNLEWLARDTDDLEQMYLCEFAYLAKYGMYCEVGECDDCEMRNVSELIKTLNEEHEEERQ